MLVSNSLTSTYTHGGIPVTNFKLPSIRKMFIPDKGNVIIDVDLSGADAQVVAWEAGDEDLKAAFRAGLDVHTKNVNDMWPGMDPKAARPGSKKPIRAENKIAVHLTNYGGKPRTMAMNLGWRVADSERFQSKWFQAHPGILEWHQRTEYALQTTRTIFNSFGYRIKYFDRVDDLLPTALAWTPQSTVGLVCSKGGVQVGDNLPWASIMLQVHDSLVMQVPFHRINPSSMEELKRHLEVVVPYADPLVIPWGLAMSPKSWGHVEKMSWTLEVVK